MKPIALLVHVSNIQSAIDWYAKAFPQAVRLNQAAEDIVILKFPEFQIEIVLEDKKVTSGGAGTVMYWQVDSLTQELQRLKELGCKLYRGPMDIENNESMCQLQDPFGNLIGLRGCL